MSTLHRGELGGTLQPLNLSSWQVWPLVDGRLDSPVASVDSSLIFRCHLWVLTRAHLLAWAAVHLFGFMVANGSFVELQWSGRKNRLKKLKNYRVF